MADPITHSASGLDLSPRFVSSSAIVGSPATNAETVVCQLAALPGQSGTQLGVFLSGVVSFTVGTSGASVRLRIRQGVAAGAGTVVADTGALTGGVAAAALMSQDIQGFDTAPAAGQTYCLTLQVGSGAAVSTVSQTN